MKGKKRCCICGCIFAGWGNNPWPVKEEGECCKRCDETIVIRERLKRMGIL